MFAFWYCKQLTKPDMTQSDESIGNGAFHSCTQLVGINMSNMVTSIGNGCGIYRLCSECKENYLFCRHARYRFRSPARKLGARNVHFAEDGSETGGLWICRCAAVSGGEVSVLPGEQIEIYADTTFYAVWKSSYKISLSPITFRNNSFESHPNVPDGDFIAEVTLTNIAWNCRCILLTATHGKGGQMADLCTVLRRGSRLRSAAFDNTDGNISCIKIFVLRDLQTALSMCPATVRYS